jgi:hypothetical protein
MRIIFMIRSGVTLQQNPSAASRLPVFFVIIHQSSKMGSELKNADYFQ